MRPKPSRVRVAGGSSPWQLDSMTWGLGAALFPDPHFVTWIDATRPVSWAVQIAAQYLSGMLKAIITTSTSHRCYVLHGYNLKKRTKRWNTEAIHLHALVYMRRESFEIARAST